MSDMSGTTGHVPPCFCWTDDDGDVVMEWVFGLQGAADSWRLLLCLSADEGTYLIETRERVQNCFYGDDVRPSLLRLLNDDSDDDE